MTMHIEIVRSNSDQPFHGRVVSDVGNTEPQWTTEQMKTRQAVGKACVRLAEMFGWRDPVIEWEPASAGRKYGQMVAGELKVPVARIEFVDER